MKKGLIKMNLKTFIEIVVGLLIVLIVIMGLNAAGIGAASMATSTSAMQLAKAINEVSQCIDEEETSVGNCWREVNISLPQDVKKSGNWLISWDPAEKFSGYDPMWAIWHDVDLEERDVIKREDDFWDWEEISADRCDDYLCYGLVEGQFPGKTTVEPEAMEKLIPFWIIDPCYATVRVWATSDATPDCENCIYICYVRQLEGPSNYNFCHDDRAQPVFPPDDSTWPDDPDAWITGPPGSGLPTPPGPPKQGLKCKATNWDSSELPKSYP